MLVPHSATEVDRHFAINGFNAFHPRAFCPASCRCCKAVEGWLCCGMALIRAGSKADYRLRPGAVHPDNHGPRRLWVQERPIPRMRTTAFASLSPAVTASMAPLGTRAPIESKLAPCASSARHLSYYLPPSSLERDRAV